MRHIGRGAAFLLLVLSSSSGEAQSFTAYAGGRVLGCGDASDTLNTNAECVNSQTGQVVGPAVPIATWVTAQVQGALNEAKTQNQKLQRQLDELTARVKTLEAAANRSKPGAATK